jgi:hypothetical protein
MITFTRRPHYLQESNPRYPLIAKPVRTFWRRNKCLTSAEHGTRIPRSCSHSTDWAAVQLSTVTMFTKRYVHLDHGVFITESYRNGEYDARCWKQKRARYHITGQERPRRFQKVEASTFQTVDTGRWQGCEPYAPADFTPRRHRWYSFLLEAEFTPGT